MDNSAPVIVLTFKAGEEMYLNGTLLRFDTRGKITLRNSAQYILRRHMVKFDEKMPEWEFLQWTVQCLITHPANNKVEDVLGYFQRSKYAGQLMDIYEYVRQGFYFKAFRLFNTLKPNMVNNE